MQSGVVGYSEAALIYINKSGFFRGTINFFLHIKSIVDHPPGQKSIKESCQSDTFILIHSYSKQKV